MNMHLDDDELDELQNVFVMIHYEILHLMQLYELDELAGIVIDVIDEILL